MKRLIAIALLAAAVAAVPAAPAVAGSHAKRLAPGKAMWISGQPINVQVRLYGRLTGYTYLLRRRATCYWAVETYGESCTAIYYHRSGKLKNYSKVSARITVIR